MKQNRLTNTHFRILFIVIALMVITMLFNEKSDTTNARLFAYVTVIISILISVILLKLYDWIHEPKEYKYIIFAVGESEDVFIWHREYWNEQLLDPHNTLTNLAHVIAKVRTKHKANIIGEAYAESHKWQLHKVWK